LLRHFSADDHQIRGTAQCCFLGFGQIMLDLAPLELIGQTPPAVAGSLFHRRGRLLVGGVVANGNRWGVVDHRGPVFRRGGGQVEQGSLPGIELLALAAVQLPQEERHPVLQIADAAA